MILDALNLKKSDCVGNGPDMRGLLSKIMVFVASKLGLKI